MFFNQNNDPREDMIRVHLIAKLLFGSKKVRQRTEKILLDHEKFKGVIGHTEVIWKKGDSDDVQT